MEIIDKARRLAADAGLQIPANMIGLPLAEGIIRPRKSSAPTGGCPETAWRCRRLEQLKLELKAYEVRPRVAEDRAKIAAERQEAQKRHAAALQERGRQELQTLLEASRPLSDARWGWRPQVMIPNPYRR